MAERQPYPIGDDEHGQLVQTNTVLPTQATVPEWDITYQLTVSTTSVNLGQNIYGRNYAIITCETSPVRYRLDSIAPTATIGHPIEVGGGIELESFDELNKVRFIRRDGADATLTISIGNRR